MGQSVVGPPTHGPYGRNAGPLGLRLCARSRRNRKYQGMLPRHASVLGRRSVPPVQPPARGTVTVMGRERPRLRFAKSVPGPTSGVAHAPRVCVVDLAVGSRFHPGNVERHRHRAEHLTSAALY